MQKISKVSQSLILTKSKYLRDFVGILGTNTLNNMVSFGLTVVFARLLGISEFGIASLGIAIITNLATILDFGVSVSVVRFYNIGKQQDTQQATLDIVHKWKLTLCLLVSGLAYFIKLALQFVFPILENRHGFTYIVIFSSVLLSYWMTQRAIEQAKSRFRSIEQYTLIYAGIRLFLFAIFFVTQHLTSEIFLIVIYVGPLFSLFVWNDILSSRRLLYREIFCFKNQEIRIFSHLMKYSIWVAVSTICFALFFRAPQFFLAQIAAPLELGHYSAAATFLIVLTLLNDALRTIILPQISSFREKSEFEYFSINLWRKAPIFFGAMSIVISTMIMIQYFALGEDYRDSVPIFIILSIGFVGLIYFGLHNAILHPLGLPYLDTAVNFLRLLVFITFMISPAAPTHSWLLAIVFSSIALFFEFILFIAIKIQKKRLYINRYSIS